jgi:predicted amidohydrolase YtcJ
MAARLTAYLVAFIVGTTIIAGLIVGAQREDGPVDLIVINGRVYTADGGGTMAEAVAVQGNRILHVGTSREVQRLRRPQTVVVDARGGAVLPGFNDAHTHLVNGGLSLSRLNLSQARTELEIEELLRAWAAANPDTPWLTGRGWYYAPFAGGLPTRQMIDKIVSDRPVFLTSYDGHVGWANSHALKLAGITRRTPNPANGTIVKDARTGEPTGVLKESAMRLVSSLVPAPTRDERLTAIRAAINEAHRHGVTSVQTASGSPDELALYDELRRRQELPLRVYAALSAEPDVTAETLAAYDVLKEKFADDPVFKTGVIKIIADGVIEAYTAAMLQPYANRPTTSGEPRMDAAALDTLIADLDRRGWQVMIHAIGDRAVRMALDAFDALGDPPADATRPRRHRIEHIETIDAADIPRFGQLGVIASMQPYHSLPDMGGVWSQNIGPERESRAWVYGSIARGQGRLAFGSDWPVMSLDPILGLHVAVNRTRPEDGQPEGGWIPSERLTLRQAVDAYTRDAAWASFDEHRKGSLEPDMLADIVVLSRDIFGLPSDRLTEADVVVTIFDGRVVYQRSASTN